jgi:hypothetical protein
MSERRANFTVPHKHENANPRTDYSFLHEHWKRLARNSANDALQGRFVAGVHRPGLDASRTII